MRKEQYTTTAIKIDKGVPLPSGPVRGRPVKYPLHLMKVGDSFLLPPNMNRNAAYQVAYNANKKEIGMFTVRMTDEGFRCWRTA